MLTAKGKEIDRIVGFELGADDYVVKPFSPREFVLRIKAYGRQSNSGTFIFLQEHILKGDYSLITKTCCKRT